MSNAKVFRQMEVHLSTLTPLRIGGKDDPMSGRENSTVSFGNAPIVPGPSLKGALRSAMERYLISTFYNADRRKWTEGLEPLRPCVPNPRPSPEEEALIKAGRYCGHGCGYSAQPNEQICPVCYLLGAQGLSGFVNVPFLLAEAGPVQELYSLRIDRGTGTSPARRGEGGNRPYEVVRPDVEFRGTLAVLMHDPARGWRFGEPRVLGDGLRPDVWLEKNVWPNQPDLLRFLVDMLESIDVIGGYKSKGCGRVKIEVTEIK